MIDNIAIENVLLEWANGLTGSVVIIEDQSKPRPTTPYISLKITTFIPVGYAGKEETAVPVDLVKFDYSTTYDILVSINFYRDGAFTNASKLRDGFDSISVIEGLESNGLFFISTSDIRDIPNVVKKKFEERYQMDVSFYIRSASTETLEQIKKIELTNELDGSTEIIE